jgi:hypothetical protein
MMRRDLFVLTLVVALAGCKRKPPPAPPEERLVDAATSAPPAASRPSPPAPPAHDGELVWQVAFPAASDLDGDGKPEIFGGIIWKRKIDVHRKFDPADLETHLAALDGDTYRLRWESVTIAQPVDIVAIGDRLLVQDRGRTRIFSATDGKLVTDLVGVDAGRICRPLEGGTEKRVWIGREKGGFLDLATTKLDPAPIPTHCKPDKSLDPCHIRGPERFSACIPLATTPAIPGMTKVWAITNGIVSAVLGNAVSPPKAPMAALFDPNTRRIVWSGGLSPAPADATDEAPFGAEIVGRTLYVAYGVKKKPGQLLPDEHVTAIDADLHKARFDFEISMNVRGIVPAGPRLLLVWPPIVDVRDIQTGAALTQIK